MNSNHGRREVTGSGVFQGLEGQVVLKCLPKSAPPIHDMYVSATSSYRLGHEQDYAATLLVSLGWQQLPPLQLVLVRLGRQLAIMQCMAAYIRVRPLAPAVC